MVVSGEVVYEVVRSARRLRLRVRWCRRRHQLVPTSSAEGTFAALPGDFA